MKYREMSLISFNLFILFFFSAINRESPDQLKLELSSHRRDQHDRDIGSGLMFLDEKKFTATLRKRFFSNFYCHLFYGFFNYNFISYCLLYVSLTFFFISVNIN